MEIASPLPPRVRTSQARLGLIVTALIVLVAGYGATKTTAFQWFLLKASLRNQFPHVGWITTRELAGWLQDEGRQLPVLLDVRTAEEWNVSHLPGARRVEPGIFAGAALPDTSKDTDVVLYDAVGYRAADLATRLRAAGFTHVQCLDGSIFQWANEHRPMVRNGDWVTRVHPYTQYWRRLLTDDVRAPL